MICLHRGVDGEVGTQLPCRLERRASRAGRKANRLMGCGLGDAVSKVRDEAMLISVKLRSWPFILLGVSVNRQPLQPQARGARV